MRVTNIDICTSNLGNIINLNFRDPTSQSPYIVKDIIGLDADDITPKYYASDMSDNKYYDLALKKREVVIKVGLNPNFALGKSYAALRDDLYRLVQSSRTGAIQLRFNDETGVKAAVSGFVTRFESPNFTRTPEVQLTISCNESMLKAVDEVNVPVEFLVNPLTIITDDESTAPHGVRFGLQFTDTVIDASIQDALPANWAFEVNLTGSSLTEFVIGDELHLSSEANNRYLYLVRGFDIIHLVDRIIPTSIWPLMFPGENQFMRSEFIRWDYITYFPTYWGV